MLLEHCEPSGAGETFIYSKLLSNCNVTVGAAVHTAKKTMQQI
jgi:hypothetical protein